MKDRSVVFADREPGVVGRKNVHTHSCPHPHPHLHHRPRLERPQTCVQRQFTPTQIKPNSNHTHNTPGLDSKMSGGDLPANRGCTASDTMGRSSNTHTHTHTHTHSQPTQARQQDSWQRLPCQQRMHSLRHNATPLSSNTTHSQPTQAREENIRRRPPCQQGMHSLRHNATPLSSNTHTHTHTHSPPRLERRMSGGDLPASRRCTASGTMRPHLAPTHTLTTYPG